MKLDRAPRLQNESTPPWRVSRLSAKAEPVSMSPPRPIPTNPPPSSPANAPIGPDTALAGSAAANDPPPASPAIPSGAAPPTGEPDSGSWTTAPPGCRAAGPPSWLTKLSASLRSMPGRNS